MNNRASGELRVAWRAFFPPSSQVFFSSTFSSVPTGDPGSGIVNRFSSLVFVFFLFYVLSIFLPLDSGFLSLFLPLLDCRDNEEEKLNMKRSKKITYVFQILFYFFQFFSAPSSVIFPFHLYPPIFFVRSVSIFYSVSLVDVCMLVTQSLD